MSFRRNLPESGDLSTLSIPGVRKWFGNVYLTSSGVSGLDEAVGGGIPVNSMLLLKHDEPTSNYLTIIRCFLAEGVARGHCVIKGSPTSSIGNDTLPLVVGKSAKSRSHNTVSDKLKISWRYKNMHQQQHLQQEQQQQRGSSLSAVTPSDFNLSKTMEKDMLIQNSPFDIALRSFSRFPTGSDEFYDDLICSISSQLKLKRCLGESPFNIGRIALESIISPYLGYDPALSLRSLIRFLHRLRHLARTSFSIIMVSIPAHIMKADDCNRLEHLFDFVLKLHSFTGRNSVYGDYDGLIEMEKLSKKHLKTDRPHSDKWLYKLKKSEMVMERPSMPVDDSSKEDTVLATACSGGALPKALDF